MNLHRLAALLVLGAALAVAAAPRAQQPSVSTEARVSVAAYGASPAPSFDNAPAFQAAHDELARRLAANPGSKGSLFVPSSLATYNLAAPLYMDAAGIVLESDGGGASLQTGMLSANGVTFVGCPAVAVGVRRPQSIGGQFLANFASYRPDCFGKLDASVAPAAGKRWGFRTNTNAFVMAHGSPFSHGGTSPKLGPGYVDCWAETQTLTIELAVEGFAGGKLPPNTTLFVVGSGVDDEPFWFYTDVSGNFKLDFQTQAVRFGQYAGYGMTFPQAPAGGVQRVTLQLDLAHGIVSGWLNGVQQYTGSGINTMTPGAYFRENDDFPFLIGGSGVYDAWGQTPNDFAVYGLAMSKTLRYKILANGSPQVRVLDGANFSFIKDNYRYGDDGTDRGDDGKTSGLIGYFAFLEPPAALSPMLSIPISSTNYAAPAFIGYRGQWSLGGIQNQGLKNLRLTNARSYGSALMIGEVLDLKVADCDFAGGFWSAANLPMGANYTLIFDRCSFSSYGDAALYLCVAIARLRDCEIRNGGRVNMRLRETDLLVDSLFIAGANANCQFSLLRFHSGTTGGGKVSIHDVTQDIEGAPYPSRGVVGIQRSSLGAFFRLTDIDAGVAPGVPFLWLDATTAGAWPANTVATDNANASGVSATAVSNGAGWTLNGAAVPVSVVPVTPPTSK